MKRFILALVAILGVTVVPAWVYAQSIADSEVIVLDDAVPGIDVIINPIPGTTGAVVMEINQASVTLLDSVDNVVFQTTDPKVGAVELRFAPDAGQHRLVAQRLAGASQAYVRVASLNDLTYSSAETLVSADPVGLGQERDLPLNTSSPSATTRISVPQDSTGAVTVRVPGVPVTVQIVDHSTGAAVATLYAGQIDGLSVTLPSGEYDLALLSNDPSIRTVANISLLQTNETDFGARVDALVQAAAAQETNTASTAGTTQNNAAVASNTTTTSPASPVDNNTAATSSNVCMASVNAGSVILRSGPGTGYSVLGYAFRGDEFAAGGVNLDNSWVLVAIDATDAGWLDRSTTLLNGSCSSLAVYNIPTLNASAPSVTFSGGEDDEYEGGGSDGGGYEGGEGGS